VGLGYDVHPFAQGRRLVLGGVEIPSSKGLAGFSDADVLLHALMDALLGAAGLGDMGVYFPPGDERFRDADSRQLAAQTVEMIRSRGLEVVNIDSVVIAQEPRLAEHLAAMRREIARVLGVASEQVNVKAKSPEALGALGRSEGICAQAVALLRYSAAD